PAAPPAARPLRADRAAALDRRAEPLVVLLAVAPHRVVERLRAHVAPPGETTRPMAPPGTIPRRTVELAHRDRNPVYGRGRPLCPAGLARAGGTYFPSPNPLLAY